MPLIGAVVVHVTGSVPIAVVPLKNSTLPGGAEPSLAVTVAVSVIAVPDATGFADDASVVAVVGVTGPVLLSVIVDADTSVTNTDCTGSGVPCRPEPG